MQTYTFALECSIHAGNQLSANVMPFCATCRPYLPYLPCLAQSCPLKKRTIAPPCARQPSAGQLHVLAVASCAGHPRYRASKSVARTSSTYSGGHAASQLFSNAAHIKAHTTTFATLTHSRFAMQNRNGRDLCFASAMRPLHVVESFLKPDRRSEHVLSHA